jgi:hypothetical protein
MGSSFPRTIGPYDQKVAYDEDLANRIRELIGGRPGLTEQPMFGGLAFPINGHMAVAASRQGGLLVRVGPDDVRTKRELEKWVRVGTEYADSLPVKKKRKR